MLCETGQVSERQYLLSSTDLLQEPTRAGSTGVMSHAYHHQLTKVLTPDLYATTRLSLHCVFLASQVMLTPDLYTTTHCCCMAVSTNDTQHLILQQAEHLVVLARLVSTDAG